MKPRVLVTQKTPQAVIEALAQKAMVEAVGREGRILTKAELCQRLKRNEYLLCLSADRIDAEVMDVNPNLKIIANMAVGYDNIDVAGATERGIPVTNTPGVLTETTADLAWALLMAVARRIPEADRFTRQGRFKAWGPLLLLGADVHGKTLGIVGLGRIGQAVALRALGFGMRVLYYDVHRLEPRVERRLRASYADSRQLLQEADFVTLHAPYTRETHHLIGAAELALMKPSAYLVNTARGPLVDERALVRALQAGQIAGAALDVYEHEPKVEPQLLKMKNVVLAPHIGSATLETRTKMALLAARNILAVIEGKRPPSLVNPEVYTRAGRRAP